jgi:hypothetical protein
MLVDIPDAVLRAIIDDLLSSSLQTYRGLVVFLPLMRGCTLEYVLWLLWPLPVVLFELFEQFDMLFIYL